MDGDILVPITLFLVTGAVIVSVLVLKYFRRKVESQEILAAIEKGVEVKFPEQTRSRLLPGLMWLLIGIVVSLAMALAIPDEAPAGMWVWGLIPVAVGAAYLIVHRVESLQEEDEQV